MTSSSILQTEICSVTVHPLGATITRQAPLAKGQRALRVEELPLDLLDDSVQVSLLQGSPGLHAYQVSVGLQATGVQELAQVKSDLKDAELKAKLIRTRLSNSQTLFAKLCKALPATRQNPSSGEAPPPQNLTRQLAFLDFRAEKVSELSQEIETFTEELRVLENRLHELRELEAKQASETRPEDLRKFVDIRLSAECAGESAQLLLSYRVDGACWTPSYTAQFEPDFKSLRISMRAFVSQCSQEDWTSVELKVSTADPQGFRECPKLKSQRLARVQVSQLRPTWRPAPLGTDALFASFDEARPQIVHDARPSEAPEFIDSVEVFAADFEADGAGQRPIGGKLGEMVPSGVSFSSIASAVEDVSQELLKSSAPLGSAAPGRSRSESPLKKRSPLQEGGARGGALSRELVQTLDERLWQYGQLRMMGANRHRRGELEWHSESQLYLEYSSLSLSLVQRALRTRDASVAILQAHGLAPGHSLPGAVNGFDYQYEAQGLVDVLADGQHHSVALRSFELECKAHYVVVPRESLAVFRSAQFTNPGESALLAGPVDVLIGDEFLHTASFENVNPTANCELGLGVCESIKIKRQTHFKESTSGLMGGTTVLAHSVELEAVNHLSTDLQLEIRERLPEVSEEFKNEVKVELERVQPAWQPFTQDGSPEMKSTHRWLLQIPAQSSVTASLNYTVSMPSKYELVNGNRREMMS